MRRTYSEGFDDGLLKGSEVGDAAARRALKERDQDMDRLQRERIEIHESKKKVVAENEDLKLQVLRLKEALEYQARVNHGYSRLAGEAFRGKPLDAGQRAFLERDREIWGEKFTYET